MPALRHGFGELDTWTVTAAPTAAVTAASTNLNNNEAYTAGFSGPLPLPPAKHIAVLACMDARLNVYGALGVNGQFLVPAGGQVEVPTLRWYFRWS